MHVCQDSFVAYTRELGATVADIVFPDSIALAINSAGTSNQEPLMFSNKIQKSSSYMLGSGTAFRVTAIWTLMVPER